VTEDAEQGCHICIVGTKLDLVQAQVASRMVRKEEVDELAAKYHADVFETSAKAGTGVGDIFARVVEHFHSRVQVDQGRQGGVAMGGGAQKKEGGCC
jgi:translation elongation factor EF-4